MTRRAAALFAALGFQAIAGVCAATPAFADALTRLDQVGPALRACWTPPAGSEGSRIVFRFGLTTAGALKGAPLITHSRLTGDMGQQRAFVAAAFSALARCTPLDVTPELGRALSSRVLTLTFSVPSRERGVDI